MRINQDFVMATETVLFLKEARSRDFIQSKEIAEALDLSVGYLQKVVQTLGKQGIVECKRGRVGGVRLRSSLITLLDLWEVTTGSLEYTDPPLSLMNKPLKAFRDAMKSVVLYKRSGRRK